MSNQLTRIVKTVSKVPSVHTEACVFTTHNKYSNICNLDIRGTMIKKTFTFMFGEMRANWHFDRVQKEPEKTICLLYSPTILSSF